MISVLLKAISFVLIILLGYVLKKKFFRDPSHQKILTFILLNITLPATVIHAFSRFRHDASQLSIVFFGFLCAVIPILAVFLTSAGQPVEKRVFTMINVTGFNIGAFSLPLVQNFFGQQGMVIACLFDIGNAFMVAGGSFAITTSLLQTGVQEERSVFSFFRKFFYSVPFDTYMLMLVVALFDIHIPDTVISFLEPVSNANAFIAMLLIGMMFEFRARADKYKTLFTVIGWRLAFGALFSFLLYTFLPFDLEIRQVLAVIAFAPVSSLAPIYTLKCEGDSALSSLTLSVSILFSLAIMTSLVLFMTT